MILPRYSIAIRTLGTAGEKFRVELESIRRQTVQPDRVIVYVADTSGVKFVDGTIGKEEFRYIPKGMVAQRSLVYEEIDAPYILLLDDDVELAPDSAERMLKAMIDKDADCIGADTFKNQEMPLPMKWFAILTNLVTWHNDAKFAYKIRLNGSFCYLKKVSETCLPTQKVDGPCALWKKETLLSLHWEDERWMDELSDFAYGDDQVESYKAFVNGYHLFLLYDAGVKYLNAKTASSTYHHTHRKFYIRSLMSACIWYRTIWEVQCQRYECKTWALHSFAAKAVWLFVVNIVTGFLLLDLKIPFYYLEGIRDAWRFVHSSHYRSIRPYILVSEEQLTSKT